MCSATPSRYKSVIYGKNSGDDIPIRTDLSGRMVLSPSRYVPITATDLDIRDLSYASDSLSVTGTNVDIRSLNGAQDSVKIFNKSFASGSESGTIGLFSFRIFLPKNVGAYHYNTYYVRNMSISVAVTVSLQIAPADIDAYYVTDGSSFNLLGGNTHVFKPSKLMKYARIRVSAAASVGDVTVSYFGQA